MHRHATIGLSRWLVAALAVACVLPGAAQQVGRETPAPRTRAPDYQAQQTGERRDSIACMELLGRCSERANACSADLGRCASAQATLRQDLDAANAELAQLRPQAALPVCSGRKEWLHAVLPTVQCWPYACGDTPFACRRECDEQLDCAPGRHCAADGRCLAPP